MAKRKSILQQHIEQQNKINELARILYYSMGYNVEKDFDFTESSHPQESMCYYMAVRVINFLENNQYPPDMKR